MSGTALTNTAPASLPYLSAGVASGVRADGASTTAFAGVAMLMLAAPFEAVAPLIRLPAQSVSNLEAALAAAFLGWLSALVWTRRAPVWRTPLTGPWMLLIAAMTVAALAAPIARLNALHMTGRVAAAFGVYLLAVNGVTTRARLLAAIALALVAGAAVSVLAVLEYFTVPAVLQWLKTFRPQVMTVGAVVRAGGSLQYPTIASMYLEVVFALGVGLMVASHDASRRARVALLFATLLFVAYAITLTFTRSGLILMAVTLVWCGAMRVRRACPERSRRAGFESGARLVALLGGAIAVMFFGSRSLDSIWLRFTTEAQETWYRAGIEAPAEVTLVTGSSTSIPVTLTNHGRLEWSSQADSPFFLSYHWMLADEEQYVVFDGVRTPFDSLVPPGGVVSMSAVVRAPRRPGRYRLVWDLVQERRTWFSDEPGATVVMSRATVEGAALAGAPQPFPRPRPGLRPRRLVLWRAAGRMFAAHPLLGTGPDNFRLTYGSYAEMGTEVGGTRFTGTEVGGTKSTSPTSVPVPPALSADTRTHSNNMYLEMLAGGGLVTAAAFAWWLWAAARTCAAGIARSAASAASRLRRARAGDGGAIAVGIAAAGIAMALHGLVDSFLAFAPIYVIFSLTLGLAAACARGVETCADAHRI